MDILDLQVIFSDRVKGLMIEKNLNQSDFSDAINISRPTITNWLNCKRAPQIDSIYKIAKFFNVTADYLLGLED